MNEQIKNKIQELEILAEKIELVEKHLGVLKDQYKVLKDTDLVGLLSEAGISKVNTMNGDEITIKMALNVSQKNPELVARWCEYVGYKEAIKTALEFEKGQDLGGVEAELRTEGIKYEKKEGVNTNTLKSIVKRIFDEDGSLPGDNSGMEVNTYVYADIKRSRE